jgi:hypothetical protein
MNEITCGLKLLVVYKSGTSVEKMEKTLDGFHSRVSKHSKKESGIVNILLFTSIESLEAAKIKLDKDENVESTEYLGRRNVRNQVHTSPSFLKISIKTFYLSSQVFVNAARYF